MDGFTWKDAARFQSYFLRCGDDDERVASDCPRSHFHSDHYMGISKGFHHGKICTAGHALP